MLEVSHAIDVQVESSPVTLMGSSGGRKGLFSSGKANPKSDDEEPLAGIG